MLFTFSTGRYWQKLGRNMVHMGHGASSIQQGWACLTGSGVCAKTLGWVGQTLGETMSNGGSAA